MKRIWAPVVVFFSILFLFSSLGFAQKIDLKLMTGPMGGSWYPLGGAIGEALQKEIPGLSVP